MLLNQLQRVLLNLLWKIPYKLGGDKMEDKFLPIGSVVILKKGKKPIMIIGYKMSSVNNNYIMKGTDVISDKIFDYCAVLYPEGLIDSQNFILFDHNSIEKIIFKGFISDDSEKLNVLLSKI